MEKKIIIRDYQGTAIPVTIKNFEKVSTIICSVVSGDEILQVFYSDGTSEEFDSCPDLRQIGYFDGSTVIPLDRLDEFSSITDSYDMLKKF